MRQSASEYISLPINVPMTDAWGYFNLSTPASPTVTDHANVSTIAKLGSGRYGVTFAASDRFSSNAYVVLATPEYASDTGIGPVCCRIASTVGNTAAGKSAGFEFNTFSYTNGFHSGGGTANRVDNTNSLKVAIAAFSFSDDNRTHSVSGTTYSTVPGACGYGVSGPTYNSHLTNLQSKRAATAYGTIVIPQLKGNSSQVVAYVEGGYNVFGVSAGANSVFDITFVKPLTNTNYCVILSGEYESEQQTAATTTISSTNEFSDLLVRAGTANRFKTVNGFRVESRKQSETDNSWTLQSVAFQSGRTERIHFMVFGGATYGQP